MRNQWTLAPVSKQWDSLNCSKWRLWKDRIKFIQLSRGTMQIHSHQSYLASSVGSQPQRSPLLWPRPSYCVWTTLCCGVRLWPGSSFRGQLISAVQRAFLDRFDNHGAQQSDHRTRVIAAYHRAAWHYHVGSGLEQTPKRSSLNQINSL